MLRGHPHQQSIFAVATGLAVTALCLAAFFSSAEDTRLEQQAYDFRMRHCNNLEPTSPIIHVDIDDSSLNRVGRWPWSRDKIADILRILHELGASHIMIDLLFTEPEPPFFDDPALDPFLVSHEGVETLGEASEDNWVYPDLELAEALRTCGNVFLAAEMGIHSPLKPPDSSPSEAATRRDQLRDLVCSELRADFTLTDAAIASRLARPISEITAVIAGAKTEVARELVRRLSSSQSLPPADEVLQAILRSRANLLNADRTDIIKAIFAEQGRIALRKSMYPAPPAAANFCRMRKAVPHPRLVEAAGHVACVNFEPDADGTTRRVPIAVRDEDLLLNHLGFAAACAILRLDPSKMSSPRSGKISLPRLDGGPPLIIPIDADGEVLIHWTRTAKNWRTDADVRHIPAAKIWAAADARRQIRENETAINYLLAEAIALSKGEIQIAAHGATTAPATMRADAAYRRKVNEQLALARKIRRSRLQNDASPGIADLEKESAALLNEIAREQKNAVAGIRLALRDFQDLEPAEIAADPQLQKDLDRFKKAEALLDGDIARRRTAITALEKTAADTMKELGEVIRGKEVFFGYAATALGDIVPTSIDPSTIGVMCHAAVLNSFLQNRFISRVPRYWEIVLCAALGAVVSLITGTRGPRLALFFTLALMTAYALFNAYILFQRYDIWLVIVAPLVTVFVTWAFVTLFRQLTAEREKRLFAKQLSLYTSPAIAAKIAESPQAIAAFKTVQTRDVTCYFSDLAGFTSISERENPETVQHVLNAYLERMCQVIWARRGLINKFMGDGIMAFFNPSVDPLADHPRIACETALATLNEVEALKRERETDPDAGVFKQLSMRVGLSTGLAKNGDLGSELKADYTVIGDVVNLAARLEPANKVFGTNILISGPLREAVKDDFEFRYLAELQVKGKAATVPVYELICRKGELADEQRQYIERFEAGVELYKQRKWDECIVHFTRMLSRRFDDVGASRYVDACQEFKQFPPDENWRGALELKEK